MIKIVNLILVCQTKDDKIPQLIPLFWVNASLILLIFLITLILVFRINYIFICNLNQSKKIYNNFIWCW